MQEVKVGSEIMVRMRVTQDLDSLWRLEAVHEKPLIGYLVDKKGLIWEPVEYGVDWKQEEIDQYYMRHSQ